MPQASVFFPNKANMQDNS